MTGQWHSVLMITLSNIKLFISSESLYRKNLPVSTSLQRAGTLLFVPLILSSDELAMKRGLSWIFGLNSEHLNKSNARMNVLSRIHMLQFIAWMYALPHWHEYIYIRIHISLCTLFYTPSLCDPDVTITFSWEFSLVLGHYSFQHGFIDFPPRAAVCFEVCCRLIRCRLFNVLSYETNMLIKYHEV